MSEIFTIFSFCFFFQAEDGIRYFHVTGVQTCALPIFAFSKRFHVSPFNGMNQHYQWLFSFRGPELRIHMNVEEENRKYFDATLEIGRASCRGREESRGGSARLRDKENSRCGHARRLGW